MRRPDTIAIPMPARLSAGERLTFAVLALAAISALVPMRIAASEVVPAPVARACPAPDGPAHPYGSGIVPCPDPAADRLAVTASAAAFRMAAIFVP